MKFNIKNIVRSASLMSLATLSLVACEDEPDKYEVAGGNPEVIYVCMPTNKDSLITSAFTNNRVVLIGNNLRSITKLFFNDQEAVLNSSLITDHALFVTVPRSLPNNPTDKIYMHNEDGNVTEYPFTVDIAAPLLASMDCEYVAPGEVATINGDYLLSYDNFPMVITMPDGTQITDFKSLSQTSVSFVVPDGCTQSGPITVTSKYGTSKSTKFNFNDNRGIMADFNAGGGVSSNGKAPQGWNISATYSSEGGIAGCGEYCQLGDGTLETEGGWTENFKLPFWAGNWGGDPYGIAAGEAGTPFCNLIDFSDFQNMALKFELYIPKANPWSAGAMQLVFANASPAADDKSAGKAGIAANDTWQNNLYIKTSAEGGGDICRGLYRPWETTGSFDTDDKWITVTVPFSEFVYNFDGTKGTRALQTEEDFATFVLWPIQGGVSGTACKPIFRIDNIRAVPYK